MANRFCEKTLGGVGFWALLLASLAAACGGRSDSQAYISSTIDSGSVICPTSRPDVCDAECVDTKSDSDHCGACGERCDDNEMCEDGVCTPVCANGRTLCGGACVDTDSSEDHCGGCASGPGPRGQRCGPGEVCREGSCESNCSGARPLLCDGSCVNPNTNRQNCGRCGARCADDEDCVDGACTLNCESGLTDCAGACRDLASDEVNCGECGQSCAPDEVCQNASCTPICGPGLVECAGRCVDLLSDASNCGECGMVCAGNLLCSEGSCTCGVGLTACGAACVNLQTDAGNCGACGNSCDADQRCEAGACHSLCAPGLTECGNVCVDTNVDREHCGQCNQACGTDELCEAGSCEPEHPVAKCADLLTDMDVWGEPARGIDLRDYTESTLHWIGCTLGCQPSSFYCTETDSTLQFGTNEDTANSTLRALVDPNDELGDEIPDSYDWCCSADAPNDVCNAPDSSGNDLGVSSADALCRALGYSSGTLLREGTTNYCPEPHALGEDGTRWDSDFVESDGFGAEYLCTR